MKRSHVFHRKYEPEHTETSREIAIHEAGHAAAIYLANKQKGLPPVYFNIYINPLKTSRQTLELKIKYPHQYAARIEGGRLIHTLPYSFNEATKEFSLSQKRSYERAFEADIFNFLVGPLAEARYVSLRDDEAINFGLVNINSLHFYGGSSDLEIVNEYIDCYLDKDALKTNKISDLFKDAQNFIKNQSNWLAITSLADVILANQKNIIEYKDIIATLEYSRHVVGAHTVLAPTYFHLNPVKQAFIELDKSLPNPQSSLLCAATRQSNI